MNVQKNLPAIFNQDNDRQCFGFFMCATLYFKTIGAQGILCWLREYRVMYMKRQKSEDQQQNLSKKNFNATVQGDLTNFCCDENFLQQKCTSLSYRLVTTDSQFFVINMVLVIPLNCYTCPNYISSLISKIMNCQTIISINHVILFFSISHMFIRIFPAFQGF